MKNKPTSIRYVSLKRYFNLMLLLLIAHMIVGLLFLIFPFGLDTYPFRYVGQLHSIIYIAVKWLVLDMVGIALCLLRWRIAFLYVAVINLIIFIYNKKVSAPILSLFSSGTMLVGQLSVGLQLLMFILSLVAIVIIVFDNVQ